jgi:hypothetical protein
VYSGISGTYLTALRGPHTAYGYCEAWYGGARLDVPMPDGSTSTRLPLRVDGTNEVRVDGTTPGSRRTVSLTLPNTDPLWNLLSPIGVELKPFTVLKYMNGVTEAVPQGVFPVDVQRMGYGPGGTLTLTAPDRWDRVKKARFFAPRQFGGGTNRALIATLLGEVFPALTVSDTATSGVTVPVQTEDRDRAGFLGKLAAAASVDVGFDRNGSPFIRNVPTISNSPVWDVDAGPSGVLVDADRSRDRQRTYNIVVVNGQTTDGTAPFPTVYVWDNDSTSPTFAGSGTGSGTTPPSAGTAGPFGQVPYFYTSPLLTTSAQAIAAGQTLLEKVRGLAAQLTASAYTNPALDDGDTIRVSLPKRRWDQPRPVELHIADAFTVPLVPSKNAQRIETRSTKADLPAEGA